MENAQIIEHTVIQWPLYVLAHTSVYLRFYLYENVQEQIHFPGKVI